MTLFDHQKKIIAEDPKKCGLFLGTGGAKTRTALELARGKTLVIAPKTQVLDGNWVRENEKWEIGVDLTVIQKETFRRDWKKLPSFETVIVDESHTVAGVQPTVRWQNRQPRPKASQLFEALDGYLEARPPTRLYLLTATPVKSPMSVWAHARLLGKRWDFYEFRDTFYVKLPMPGREAWKPRSDASSKERLAKAVKSLGYTGRLEDWFDVPDQVFRTMYSELSGEQKRAIEELPLHYPDPLVLLGKTHQVENGVLAEDFEETRRFKSEKPEQILSLYEEFGKVLVFAKYTAQIEALEEFLTKQKVRVFVLTGKTKERGELLRGAESSEACVFIAQSQISAGYELPSFRCTVFASMSYSQVDFVQSLGRTQRANHISKNLYVFLLSGEVDRAVYKSVVIEKQDFHEHVYAQKRSSLHN